MIATLTRKRKPRPPAEHPWTEWVNARGLLPIPGYCPIESAAPGDWFDPDAADKIIEFFADYLHHVKGPLARKPYKPMPFEQTVFGCALGWKREDGLRRYRKVFEYIPKKNSKTTRAAGLVLYFTGCDGEYGAEVYSIAKTKEQASLIFKTAMEMRKLNSHLQSHFVVYGSSGGSQQKSIVCEDMGGSSYRPLAYDDDAADGLNIHAAVIDELHRHDSGAMLDIIERNTSARSQPMIWVITTADYVRESVCNRELSMAKLIRDNRGDRSKPGYAPHVLPVIYEADKADDFTDEAVWHRVNPGLGASKGLDYMRKECEKAKVDPISRNNFLRFELNVQTEQLESLFNLVEWDKCPSKIDENSLAGRKCFGGLDLGQRDDLSSYALCFPPDDRDGGDWAFLWFTWCCADAYRKRVMQNDPYAAWASSKHLIVTPGSTTDWGAVRDKILWSRQRYAVESIAFDPALASNLTDDLFNAHGVPVAACHQGYQAMSEPTLKMRQLIMDHKINHGGDPVARWAAGNAMSDANLVEHTRPVKGKSKDKIDPIVAAIMALKGAMKAPAGAPQVLWI